MTEDYSELNRDVLLKYLKIYNADLDWNPHLDDLKRKFYANRLKANGDFKTIEDLNTYKTQIAATILMPAFDRSLGKNGFPPERLLFGCTKFGNFEAQDWLKVLKKIYKEDNDNLQVRQQAVELGVVYPIEYNPLTRQAYNWLMNAADDSETIRDTKREDVSHKMENLVLIYGGAVICNIFDKPDYSRQIKNLVNWRTGYFFERLIHQVYKPEEVLKIKRFDIEAIRRNNPELIKKKA